MKRMITAPSFRKMEWVCDPFVENGRDYVKVKNAKTGTVRKVRLYPAPYRKLASLKDTLGFNEGFITLFKGKNDEFFKKSNARWHNYWGWYVVSTEEVPELPNDITSFHLAYDEAFNDPDELKSEYEISLAIGKKMLYL